MKRVSIFFATVMFLASCGRADISVIEVQQSSNDSLCSINISFPSFSSTSSPVNGKLTVLNSDIKTYVDTVSAEVMSQAVDMRRSMTESGMDLPQWNCELNIAGQCMYADKNLISVLFTTYTYMGGAHGMTQYEALNFDMKTGSALANEQIIDYSRSEQIDALLAEFFSNPDNCFWENPTLDKVSAITLDESSVTFIFEQYVLGPYSCGAAKVSVPMQNMEEFLSVKM